MVKGINTERTNWGTLLTVHPFSGEKRLMQIFAEVKRPDDRGRVSTQVSFNGTLMNEPLKLGDLVVWSTALKAIQEKAKEVSDKYKRRPVAKKRAKKA